MLLVVLRWDDVLFEAWRQLFHGIVVVVVVVRMRTVIIVLIITVMVVVMVVVMISLEKEIRETKRKRNEEKMQSSTRTNKNDDGLMLTDLITCGAMLLRSISFQFHFHWWVSMSHVLDIIQIHSLRQLHMCAHTHIPENHKKVTCSVRSNDSTEVQCVCLYLSSFHAAYHCNCSIWFGTYHIIAITIGIVTITARATTTHKITVQMK